MNFIEQLLQQRWILKKQNPQLYYEIKDNQKELRKKLQDRFGYVLIINPLLAKLEKIPGKAEAWMGIQEFETIQEYQMFCYLLMYLEDKEIEEQFVLSMLSEYIQLRFPQGQVSWNSYQCRRQLIHVLQYALKYNLILQSDGDQDAFLKNEESEVLYENTGNSRYFMRTFARDILTFQNPEDFMQSEWVDMEENRGIVRRQRSYRRLLLSCGVYPSLDKEKDEDYTYIRNYRGKIEQDFRSMFSCDLHVHSSSAYLMLEEDCSMGKIFPQNGALHDLMLVFHSEIHKKLSKYTLRLSANEVLIMEKEKTLTLMHTVVKRNRALLPKKYQEEALSAQKLVENLYTMFLLYGFMEEDEENCYFYPIIGKIQGEFVEVKE